MKLILLVFLTLFYFQVHAAAVATSPGPLFVYEGILTDTSGSPYTTSQTVTLQILYGGSCVAYEETQTINPGAQGEFSVTLGTGTRTDLTANTADRIFATSGSIDCSGASAVTASGTASRSLHIRVGSVDLSPDIEITSVPFAITAQRLGDKQAADFAMVSANISQTRLESTFSRFSALDEALNIFGTAPAAGQVLMGGSSGFTMGSLNAGPGITMSTGTGNMTIALSDSGVTAGTYGSATMVPSLTVNEQGQVTAVIAVPLTGLGFGGTAGGDLAGTYPNPSIKASAVDEAKLATDAVTSAKIKDGEIVNADVSASAAIEDSKLATISSAGKVANSATTGASSNVPNSLVLRDANGDLSAGIINATKLNSTYSYVTELYLRNGTDKKMNFKLSPSANSDFSLTWPAGPGSAGKVLSTDGTGQLSWVEPGSGSLSASTIFAGDVTGTYNAISVDKIKGKSVNTGTYASGQVLKYTGAEWINAQIDIASDVTGVLPIVGGGTGATTQVGARLNLGLGTAATLDIGSASGKVPQLGFGGLVGNKMCTSDSSGTGINCNNSIPVSSQWATNAGSISYNAGSVGIGTNVPSSMLSVNGNADFNGSLILKGQNDAPTNFDAVKIEPYVATNTAGNEISGLSIKTKDKGDDFTALEISKEILAWSPINAHGQFTTLNYRSDNGEGHALAFYKKRGTALVPAPVKTSDRLGLISAFGYNGGGANSARSTGIGMRATENAGPAAFGGEIYFETTANGTASPTQRMVISHSGEVGIGVGAPSARLEVAGDIKANSFQATACAPGMTLVPMGRESFCISSSDQTMNTWNNAINYCVNNNTVLCTSVQYIAACNRAIIANTNSRWTDALHSISGIDVPRFVRLECSSGSAPVFSYDDAPTNHTYRCCSR